MKEMTVYLSGAISGVTEDEASGWRQTFEDRIKDISFGKARVFNPTKHFNFKDVQYGEVLDQTIMDYELNQLVHSDLVIVHFCNTKSLGTMAEMAIAYDHKIPILGYDPCCCISHPWERDMCLKIFDNCDDLIGFFSKHFIY